MIRRRGKARFLSTGGVTTPSLTSRSSRPGRSIGAIRATALPWSVTTTSSPSRTLLMYRLRLSRRTLIPTSGISPLLEPSGYLWPHPSSSQGASP